MFHDSMEHTEPTKKITNEKMKDRLHPNRLVAHPEIGMASPIARRYPVAIHCTAEYGCFHIGGNCMDGTLTIVESKSGASAPTTRQWRPCARSDRVFLLLVLYSLYS